jgi:GMP synthase-like glutamine amidotransferase
MAKSLGGRVCANGWANIGWQKVRIVPRAQGVFGASDFIAFNWHYETLRSFRRRAHPVRQPLPGTRGSRSAAPAFQCHFEVTEDIVREWCRASARELSHDRPRRQGRARILSQMKEHLPALHKIARHVYWLASPARPTVPLSRGW